MAEQEQKDDIDIVSEEKSNPKLLIIIIAVLLLAIIGLGAMIFLGGDDKDTDNANDDTKKPLVKQAPIYYAVDTPFVVNFSDQSQGEVRYLQIKLKVMARSENVIEAFVLHIPAIQHELLLLFYGQNYDNLNTSEGTKALQLQTLEKINELVSLDPSLEGNLEAVYFTSLIMQ